MDPRPLRAYRLRQAPSSPRTPLRAARPCHQSARAVSAGLHASLPDCPYRIRRGEELQERGRACRVLSLAVHAARKHSDQLYIVRQGTQIGDALYGDKLAHLLEADLGATARQNVTDLSRALLDLRLELIGNAPFLEQARKIDAAWPGGRQCD